MVRTRSVAKCDLVGNEIERYDSIDIAAKKNNTCHSVISRACSGLRKQALGFKWKFVDL